MECVLTSVLLPLTKWYRGNVKRHSKFIFPGFPDGIDQWFYSLCCFHGNDPDDLFLRSFSKETQPQFFRVVLIEFLEISNYLSCWTDRAGQIVYTQITLLLLIWVYTVCPELPVWKFTIIRAIAGQCSSPESRLVNKTKMHFTWKNLTQNHLSKRMFYILTSSPTHGMYPGVRSSRIEADSPRYCKFPKYSDTQKICCNHSKIWTIWLYHRVMHPNDADGMANSVDPDQTAVWSGSALFAQV